MRNDCWDGRSAHTHTHTVRDERRSFPRQPGALNDRRASVNSPNDEPRAGALWIVTQSPEAVRGGVNHAKLACPHRQTASSDEDRALPTMTVTETNPCRT